MALSLAIGAAALGAGSFLQNQASGRRESALNRALDQFRQEQAQINQQREAVLQQQRTGIEPLGAERQQGLSQLLAAFQGQQGAFESGQAAGAGQIAESAEQARALAPAASTLSAGVPAGLAERTQEQFVDPILRPQTESQLGLAASQMGRQAQQTELQDAFRQFGLGETGRGRQLRGLVGETGLEQERIGLQDLLSQMQSQQALESASQVGGRTAAFGGLLSSVGGGLLGGF